MYSTRSLVYFAKGTFLLTLTLSSKQTKTYKKVNITIFFLIKNWGE